MRMGLLCHSQTWFVKTITVIMAHLARAVDNYCLEGAGRSPFSSFCTLGRLRSGQQFCARAKTSSSLACSHSAAWDAL